MSFVDVVRQWERQGSLRPPSWPANIPAPPPIDRVPQRLPPLQPVSPAAAAPPRQPAGPLPATPSFQEANAIPWTPVSAAALYRVMALAARQATQAVAAVAGRATQAVAEEAASLTLGLSASVTAAIGVGGAIVFYTRTQPVHWENARNPITGQFCRSAQEYGWVTSLGNAQVDTLRRMYEAYRARGLGRPGAPGGALNLPAGPLGSTAPGASGLPASPDGLVAPAIPAVPTNPAQSRPIPIAATRTCSLPTFGHELQDMALPWLRRYYASTYNGALEQTTIPPERYPPHLRFPASPETDPSTLTESQRAELRNAERVDRLQVCAMLVVVDLQCRIVAGAFGRHALVRRGVMLPWEDVVPGRIETPRDGRPTSVRRWERLHAEEMAMEILRPQLVPLRASHPPNCIWGHLFAFCTQDPCGPDRHDCAEQLRRFAPANGLHYQAGPPHLVVLSRQQVRDDLFGQPW